LQAINDFMPALAALKKDTIVVPTLSSTSIGLELEPFIHQLGAAFDAYGSDKASVHNYHYLYSYILNDLQTTKTILEFGLGTNHKDIVSHMGKTGKPGASARAFRDCVSGAEIFGVDIDRRILFTENRIQTYWADQTSYTSLEALNTVIPDDLDLIIDDGLHCPNANVNVVAFGCRKVRKGGWIVVEDISEHALLVWQVVASLLVEDYMCFFWRSTAKGSYAFAIKRN
jgi:SAM-dependent methyltransferase